MRQFVVLCVFLALAAPGCKKKTDDKAKGGEAMAPVQAGAMTPAKRPVKRPAPKLSNLQTVLAGFSAFTAGKLDVATKGFGATGEWHNIGAPPPHNVLKGAAAVRAYFGMNKKVFAMKAIPVRVFDGGSNIVVEAVITGTHKADYMGIKATNKPVGFKAAYWFQVKDGKVHKVQAYVDGRSLLVQLGALKGKLAEHVPKAMAAPTGPPQIIQGKADPTSLAAAKQMMKLKPTDKAYAKIVDEKTIMRTANGRTIKGLQANRKMYAKFSKMASDEKIESRAVQGVGKWAIFATVDSFKLTKLKKNIRAHRLYLGLFEGGKLKQGIMYQNALEVGMQLGLVPMPKPGMKPAAMGAPKQQAPMQHAPMKKAPMKKGM